MNKILVISISLLVLFAAVATISAADSDSAVCDNCTCVVDGDAVVVDVNDTVTPDVDVSADVADVDTPVPHDAIDHVVEIENESNAVDSSANGSSASGGVCFDIHHFDKSHPDHVKITKEKRDSLKGEIDKYTKHFKKNRLVYLTKDVYGPRYSILELILDVYKGHEYDDTILIVNQVMKNCGYLSSEYQIEKLMNQMRGGTLEVDSNNYDAAHYKSEIICIELDKVYNAWKTQMNNGK